MKFIGKLLIISAFGIFLNHASTAQESINWLSWEEAVEANKKESKSIFVDIYTEWCGWCKRMDASTFKDPVIVDLFNDNFYAVKLDAEMKDSVEFNGHIFYNPNPKTRRSVHTLAASLLDNKMSYPSFVILNDKYSRLQTLAGFKDALALEPIVTYFGEGQHLEKSYEEWHKTFTPKVVKKVKPSN